MNEVKLTEKQKKNTLSAQKKKTKAPKNVLTSSLPEYWPTLSQENTEELSDLLKTITFDDYKSYTSFGLDSALRNLQKSRVKFLLMDDEITPRWFGKHQIAMALNHRKDLKIFIVPKLKDLTNEIFKRGTIMLCFMNNLGLLEEFHQKLNIHEEFLRNYVTIIKREEPPKKKKKKVIETEETPIVHLTKEGDQLAFIPQNQTESMEVETSDFISLKKYDEPKKSTYHPMKVKQVFPNPNRKKK